MVEPHLRNALSNMSNDKPGCPFTCPHCGCHDFRVVQTWYVKHGEKHRAYKCRNCGQHEFNAEVIETVRVI